MNTFCRSVDTSGHVITEMQYTRVYADGSHASFAATSSPSNAVHEICQEKRPPPSLDLRDVFLSLRIRIVPPALKKGI
jgi:hypothetical protein